MDKRKCADILFLIKLNFYLFFELITVIIFLRTGSIIFENVFLLSFIGSTLHLLFRVLTFNCFINLVEN